MTGEQQAELSARVLAVAQSGFPLEADPYAALARQLGAERSQVVQALRDLYANGSVRRVGASFSSKKLGYSSTLCALAVPAERLDEVAGIVSEYPGVTHNYRREHRYNLWFTLIARGAREAERVLEQIVQRTGCTDILNLPATRLFKIRVDFGQQQSEQRRPEQRTDASFICHPERRPKAVVEGSPAAMQESTSPASVAFDASSALDVAIVRWAQGDILRADDGTLIDRPFAAGAAHVSELCGTAIDETALLTRLRELKADGAIRRFGAMVRHQKLGYAFNGMTVWDIADERVEECGKAFAQKVFVSHCYERPRAATWPYNLYAMVHAQSQEELDAHVAELAADIQALGEPLVLVSTREYKKISMRYFEEGR